MASRLSVRWRLTLWYVVLFALALGLFSAALYVSLQHLLYQALDATLRGQTAFTQSTMEVENGVPHLPATPVTNPQQGEQFVRVADLSGRIITDTNRGAGDAPLDRTGLAVALAGHTDLRWFTVGGERVRVLSEPVIADGRVIGALQIGMFATNITETLHLVLLLIGVAGPVVLVIASGGGIWLAGRALEPVDRLTRLAAAIGEQDLSRRIDLALPNDEVGRLAHTFNAMLDRIEGAFRRQRQFTADASHELRTPLALMQSQIEVALAQTREAEQDRAVFETLAGDLDRLTRIANALLALARGDAGELRLTLDEVDLPALLDLVAEQYAVPAAEAGVHVVLGTAPVRLLADEDRLIQLLVNLVDNALRHTPRGRRISLGCRAEGESAQLWVADEGEGIAPEHLPHLFERFYRAEPERDRARGGIGLGLSICQMIATAHGGTIDLTSAPGRGTTMTVSLPRAGPPATDQRERPRARRGRHVRVETTP